MQRGEDAEGVDDLMEPAPAKAAEAADHRVGRGRGQRGEAEQGGEPNGKVKAQHDLRSDFPEVEHLIGGIEGEMDRDIGEGGDANHTAHQEESRPLQHAPQRSDGERDEKKAITPEADLVDRLVERTRAEKVGGVGQSRPQAGDEKRGEDHQLEWRETATIVAPRALQPCHAGSFRAKTLRNATTERSRSSENLSRSQAHLCSFPSIASVDGAVSGERARAT